jgi:hypothetical protein
MKEKIHFYVALKIEILLIDKYQYRSNIQCFFKMLNNVVDKKCVDARRN